MCYLYKMCLCVISIVVLCYGCASVDTTEAELLRLLSGSVFEKSDFSFLYKLIEDSAITFSSETVQGCSVECKYKLSKEQKSYLTDLVMLALCHLEDEESSKVLSSYTDDEIDWIISSAVLHIAWRRLPGAVQALCRRAQELNKPWACAAIDLLGGFSKSREIIKCLVNIMHKMDESILHSKITASDHPQRIQDYKTLHTHTADSLVRLGAREALLFLLYRWSLTVNANKTEEVFSGFAQPGHSAVSALMGYPTVTDFLSCLDEWLVSYCRGKEPEQIVPNGYTVDGMVSQLKFVYKKFSPDSYRKRILPLKKREDR